MQKMEKNVCPVPTPCNKRIKQIYLMYLSQFYRVSPTNTSFSLTSAMHHGQIQMEAAMSNLFLNN